MTAKELHVNKIVPLRKELSRLEMEYYNLYRIEKAEENGLTRADCSNCANSCVLMIDDHNCCLGNKCTCCNTFCYNWMPETKVSAYLRENHKYNEEVVWKLEKMFGDDFLKCDDIDLVLRALQLMDEIKTKSEEKNR